MKTKKIKIVLIDDEKDLLDLYKIKFGMEGFNVFAARNGKDGVELVSKYKPEVVLMDVVMPEGDGFYVLEKLHKNEETKDIPVVIFTQLDNKDDEKELINMGAADYLVKVKNTPAQVVKRVKSVLKK